MAMAMAVATKTTKPTQPTQHNTQSSALLLTINFEPFIGPFVVAALQPSFRCVAIRFDSLFVSQFTIHRRRSRGPPPRGIPGILRDPAGYKIFIFARDFCIFCFFFLPMEKSIWWQIFWRCLFFSVSAGAKMRAVWKKAWHKTLAVYIPISFISFSFSVCGGKEQREQKTEKKTWKT